MKGTVLELLNELEEGQRKHLFDIGRRIIPNLTHEDLLQPNDYPKLEITPILDMKRGFWQASKALRLRYLQKINII